MTLIIPNVNIQLLDKGACIEYLGGSLWVPKSGCAGLRSGPAASVSLSVRLGSVRVYGKEGNDRIHTTVYVLGAIK